MEEEEGFLKYMEEHVERDIWTSEGVRYHLAKFCEGIDASGRVVTLPDCEEVLSLLECAMGGYSKAVTACQLLMIPSTLVRREMALPDPYNELEEPLSWRPLANDLGLPAYALDLYLWRHCCVPEETKPKGFSAKPSSKALQALPDASDRWSIVGCMVSGIAKAFAQVGDGRDVRIVCSKNMAAELQDDWTSSILADVDIWSYPGELPGIRHLATDSNCAVLLILEEPALQPSDAAWALRVEDGPRGHQFEAPEDSAPILVVSLMQHSVEYNPHSALKKALLIVEEFLVERLDAEDSILGNFLKPFFRMPKEDREFQAAAETFREKVGPLFRQAYSASFKQLRKQRLESLAQAKASWEAREGKRKEKQARREAALDSLEAAAFDLDASLFAARAAEAAAEGTLREEDWAELQAEMYAELDELEGPLKRLVALHTQGAEDCPSSPAMQDLSTEDLDVLLALSRPPESNPWRKACQELREVLRLFAVMREEALSLDFARYSSAAFMKTALLRACSNLMRGEAALLRFESAARTAGGPPAGGAGPPLRRLLETCRDALAVAERDEALWACLSSPPWSVQPLDSGQVRPGHMADLETRGSAASGPLLSHLGEALQAALKGGSCALAIQEALQSSGSQRLEELLREARGLGLTGLEPAEQRLRELQVREESLAQLRRAAQEAFEALDLKAQDAVLEAGRRKGLVLEDEAEMRRELERSLEQAVEELSGPLLEAVEDLQGAPATARRLQLALEASRLPSAHPWREVAEAGKAALEAAAGVRLAAAQAAAAARGEEPTSEEGLASAAEALAEALALVPHALAELEERSRELGVERLARAAGLRKAQEEGEVALRGLRADEALRARLASAPWSLRPLPLQSALEGDLEELRLLEEGATIGGLHRAAAELDAALTAGRCARGLQEALERRERELIKERLQEAESLQLSGLEQAQGVLAELEALQRQAAAAPILPAAAPQSGRDDRWSEGAESSNLIFLDLELTAGFYDFDVAPRVLEAAIVVTDKDLKEKGRGTWVIGDFSREELEALGDFHQAHFRDAERSGGPFPPIGGIPGNGLFADVLASNLSREAAEEAMLSLVREHCPPGACPLSGYSVQCDREVLKVEMPRLFRYVSHQIVDVSSFLRMARLCSPERVNNWDRRASRYNHRALNDVEDSIDALRWVQEEFFRPRARG